MNAAKALKILILGGCLGLCVELHSANGEESWRTDFDVVCTQSNEVMALSVADLKGLIERCDRLQKIIEGQDETVRKVFLKRLSLCRNLYVFALDQKIQEQTSK